ncbi:CAP domain-containing protein [Micromonospora sp. ATA32]|nr:CAP domain-containing protein [Micromonospora sp. ATA32]
MGGGGVPAGAAGRRPRPGSCQCGSGCQDQADHQNRRTTAATAADAGDRAGPGGYAWRSYGENVAWNQKTPAAVMDAWMNSPGHRANILNCGFTEIGVGIATSNGPYWTQDFGTPR